MADISFNCPHCDQHLEAPAEVAGTAVECPTCGGPINVPPLETPDEEPADENAAETKKWRVPRKRKSSASHDNDEACPSCGAELKPDAVLCIECGLNLATGKHIKTDLP